MKTIILFFTLIFNIFIVKSQNITELNISYNNSDTVNVNLQVYKDEWFEYQEFIYEIDNNIITIKVCYQFYPAPGSNIMSNTFEIPIISPENYILNLEIYGDYSTTCDYTNIQNSAILNFSTPLNETVYLGINNFKDPNDQILIYPNPIKDNLFFTISNNLIINTISIYTVLGEKIYMVNIKNMLTNNIEIDKLSNGTYFVVFNTNKGTVNKQIVVNR